MGSKKLKQSQYVLAPGSDVDLAPRRVVAVGGFVPRDHPGVDQSAKCYVSSSRSVESISKVQKLSFTLPR